VRIISYATGVLTGFDAEKSGVEGDCAMLEVVLVVVLINLFALDNGLSASLGQTCLIPSLVEG
jgi:hypothetical protein